MKDEVKYKNMWGEIYHQSLDIATLFLNRGIFALSLILGIFLSAIGYPKEVITFVFFLSIFDIITKHLSEVVITYGLLTFENYCLAWKEKILTSRKLKNGIFVKLALYSVALYVANQLKIIDGIFLGKEISGMIYSALIFVELISVLENGINCGCKGLKPILLFIKNKQNKLFEIKPLRKKKEK